MQDLLNSLSMVDFDLQSFVRGDYEVPTIALAFGGGGGVAGFWTQMGMYRAMDSRGGDHPGAGGLAGLFQASTYVAGAGEGSWFVGSLAGRDWQEYEEIVSEAGSLWQFQSDMLVPQDKGLVETADYYSRLEDEVRDKLREGFPVSVTDYWGRALGRKLYDWDDDDKPLTWSRIAETRSFRNGEVPFPILTVNVDDESKEDAVSSTVIQISPIEMGSTDESIAGYADTKYVGTVVNDGIPEDQERCVTNFDSATFVVGTASSNYNKRLVNLKTEGKESILQNLASEALSPRAESEVAQSSWSPNPFYSASHPSPLRSDENLTLTAQSDGQTLPFLPLIHHTRDVDLIIAIDTSTDSRYNWPTGAALAQTHARIRAVNNVTRTGYYPEVPPPTTLLNRKLLDRPLFLGCNQSLSSPLILYLPNSPLSTYSNSTTNRLSVTPARQRALMENGYNLLTRGNGTLDDEWPACVGCAVVYREEVRRGWTQTEQCRRCFERYCWDGEVDEEETGEDWEPVVKIVGKKGAAGRVGVGGLLTLTAVLSTLGWLLV